MDTVRFGTAVRTLRRRRGWTQHHLGSRAGVSQPVVSRIERGESRSVTLGTLLRVVEQLGATASLRLYWHGADLDRLLDAAHAGLVDEVVRLLRAHGWEIVPEFTFNLRGERGSIDILAFHPGHGALLVVEVKSVVPDLQAMLAGLDRKARIAPALAAERGWRIRSVSRLLVLPSDRTARRRLATHAATVDELLPLRTWAVRRWIARPATRMGGVLFLPSMPATTSRQRIGRPRAGGAAR